MFDPEQVGFLAHAARSAARIHDKSESYRSEMAAWTTYRDSVGRDGVPPSVAVGQVPRTVPVRNFAPDGQPLLEAGPGDDRYTTYLAFATATDTKGDWLRAGEAVSAVLLTATTLGIASSVLSEVVEVRRHVHADGVEGRRREDVSGLGDGAYGEPRNPYVLSGSLMVNVVIIGLDVNSAGPAVVIARAALARLKPRPDQDDIGSRRGTRSSESD